MRQTEAGASHTGEGGKVTVVNEEVFLLDVDNTLPHNNRLATYLSARMEQAFDAADHFAMLQMVHSCNLLNYELSLLLMTQERT